MEMLNGDTFASMLRSGAAMLGEKREEVNDLNVFPIPDGDTGDNMFMTIDSGNTEVMSYDNSTLEEVAASAAKGMLLGARGNSGVILSRIFAGISHGLEGREETDVRGLSEAFKSGVEEAYRAVSIPVEGTILTVYKDAVRYASERVTDDSTFEDFFDDFLLELHSSLERTPELLAVLKESGVVDSGGAGFIYIVEGMRKALAGDQAVSCEQAISEPKKKVDISLFTEDTTLEFGYCTEFLLRLQKSKVDKDKFDLDGLIEYLNSEGDSVVAFRDDSIVKVHVHTKEPGVILNHCQKYGEFLTLKIENMTLQHHESELKKQMESSADKTDDASAVNATGKSRSGSSFRKKIRKKYGIVSVAAGEGIKDFFISLGCDAVVDGGQSMNPSTEDFIKSFEEVYADTIFVFANNSNIYLTACQAAELYKDSDVRVIDTKTIGEGYAAISMLDTSSDNIDEIISNARGSAATVVTGVVSKANREASMDGVSVIDGDYIGFVGDKIYLDTVKRDDAVIGLAKELECGSYDVAILIAGKDTNKSETNEIKNKLSGVYKRTEFIVIEGKQPIFDYMLVLM
ncbi:MAG: DAK2 domain-containing protein [Eubacterium sp.]|nr:DAK2 domain-containing protein [Eubacterium sp.]